MGIARFRSVFLGTRGALGFLTRLPVPQSTTGWTAFKDHPVTFPIAGYFLGLLFTFPFLFTLPPVMLGFFFVCWVYLITGITHIDGIADFADALVTDGSPDEKRETLSDATVGTGGTLGIGIVLLGVFSAGYLIASLPVSALAIVVAAEVIAKVSMVLVLGFGTAFHDGLAKQFSTNIHSRLVVFPVIVALPVLGIPWQTMSIVFAVVGGFTGAGIVFILSNSVLGGINGDVVGSTNELVRIFAIHLGVIGWML